MPSAITVNFFFCPPDRKLALISLTASNSNFEIKESNFFVFYFFYLELRFHQLHFKFSSTGLNHESNHHTEERNQF